MIDGLALGETTPGPLIMVVAFIGFVGGWTKQVLGPDAGNRFDIVSALIMAAAALALFRFRIGVMTLLAVCAAAGLAVRMNAA